MLETIEKLPKWNGHLYNWYNTTNLVPLILVNKEGVKLKDGRLCDITPTMLDIMGLDKPAEMTGESLLVKE